jgi:ribosomal protein L37E
MPRCRECGDDVMDLTEGYCDSCYEYHSKPEWMDDEEDFMDSYDSDRD